MERLQSLRMAAQQREHAVQRHIMEHPTIQQVVSSQVAENPSLILDLGYRQAGLDGALTTYKRILYRQGVRPIEIQEKIVALRKDMATRNGIVEFVQKMTDIGDHILGNGNKKRELTTTNSKT